MTTKIIELFEDGVKVWSKSFDLSAPAPTPTPSPPGPPPPPPPPTPPPPPPPSGIVFPSGTITLPFGQRGVINVAGIEYFKITVPSGISSWRLDVLGITNDVSLDFILTLPDGRTFTGYARGTDIAKAFDSRQAGPVLVGDYLLKISTTVGGSIVIWPQGQ